MRGKERKEEVLKQEYTDESMMAAGFTFLFGYVGNARGSIFYGNGRGYGEKKEKKRTL